MLTLRIPACTFETITEVAIDFLSWVVVDFGMLFSEQPNCNMTYCLLSQKFLLSTKLTNSIVGSSVPIYFLLRVRLDANTKYP